MWLCVVPARAGSKGLPNKNALPFCGLPLLAHSVRQAKDSGCVDLVAVSSDSEAYLEIARRHGADFLIRRPDELADDKAGTLAVMRQALEAVESEQGSRVEVLMLLQATSPLRKLAQLREAKAAFVAEPRADNLVSVCRCKDSPYFTLLEETPDSSFVHLSKTLDRAIERRQDAPPVWRINGSIYLWRREALLTNDRLVGPRTMVFKMPAAFSFDIDDQLDFDIAERAASAISWPAVESQ